LPPRWFSREADRRPARIGTPDLVRVSLQGRRAGARPSRALGIAPTPAGLRDERAHAAAFKAVGAAYETESVAGQETEACLVH
jgi:hypothetical protein